MKREINTKVAFVVLAGAMLFSSCGSSRAVSNEIVRSYDYKIEVLKDLKYLVEDDVITQEEYEVEKKKILDLK